MALPLCNMFLIGLLVRRGFICDMMTIMMIMAIIGSLGVMMKINVLSGTMIIKNRRPRKHKLRKNSCPLPGIHHDGGIGACQKKD